MHSGQAFTVPLQLSKRVPLQGDELQAWQASQTAHVVDEDTMANQHAPAELPSRYSVFPALPSSSSVSKSLTLVALALVALTLAIPESLVLSATLRLADTFLMKYSVAAQDEHRKHWKDFTHLFWLSEAPPF